MKKEYGTTHCACTTVIYIPTMNVLQHTKLVLVEPFIGCAHSGKEGKEKMGSAMVLRAALSTAMHRMLTTSPVVAWKGEMRELHIVRQLIYC